MDPAGKQGEVADTLQEESGKEAEATRTEGRDAGVKEDRKKGDRRSPGQRKREGRSRSMKRISGDARDAK